MILGVALAVPAIRRAGTAPLLAETEALVAAMSVAPSGARQTQIDNLISSLKAGGIWTKLGVLYVFAAHNAQAGRLNWKNPSGAAAVEQGTVTFTTDRGYTSDGTTGYLDTQIAWNAVPGMAQDNAHLAAYALTTTNGNGGVGVIGSNNVQIARVSGGLASRLNNATQASADAWASGASVHVVLSRSASGQYERYLNGAAVTASAVASSTPPSGNLAGLRVNTVFAPTAFSLRAMSAGSALTAGEVAAYRTAVQTYMAAIGAG